MSDPDEELFRAERAVLADEMQQRGDPHGELVALQLAREVLPDGAHNSRRRLLDRRIDETRDRLHAYLYGSLAPHVTRLSLPDLHDPVIEVLAWRAGFADSMLLQRRIAGPELPEVVTAACEIPVSRFLRDVTLGIGDHAAALAALERAAPPTLRGITLDEWKRPLKNLRATRLETITDELAALLGRIERAHFGIDTFVPFSSDTLVELRIYLQHSAPLADFELPRAPALRSLYVSSFAIDRAFFERLPPGLTSLRVTARPEASIVDAILAWPGLARLTDFAIGWGLRDDFVERVLLHADRFAHLATFELAASTFTPDLRASALARMPNLKVT